MGDDVGPEISGATGKRLEARVEILSGKVDALKLDFDLLKQKIDDRWTAWRSIVQWFAAPIATALAIKFLGKM